jgi:hypothetical protein
MNLENFAEELKKDLRQKFGEHIRFWVWPRYIGVNGFYGNGIVNNAVVIWITERPSLARDKRKEHKFPDWVDKIFYRLLKEEGFENMHLTDFVKIMDDAGKLPTEGELKISAEWMKKEIEMLKVDGKKLIIVANSKNVKRWMEKYLPEYPCLYYEFFKRILRYRKREIREKLIRDILGELTKHTL